MIEEIRIMKRGEGKTTLAVEMAKTLPNSCIVVPNHTEKRRLQHLGVYALQPHELRGHRYDAYVFDDLFFFRLDYQTLPFTLPGNHYIITSIPSDMQQDHPWFHYIFKHYPEELL